MSGQGSRAAAALAAIAIGLLLGGCGGDSDTTEPAAVEANEAPTGSGTRTNAWNNVNEQLRGDILSFGQVGSQAELEDAAVTVQAYLNARVDEDFPSACSYLSKYMLNVVKGAAKQRGESGCVAGVARLSGISSVDEIEGPVRIDPTKIRRRGKRAFVLYTDEYGDFYAQLMRPEEGTWKIQGFEPTRLR